MKVNLRPEPGTYIVVLKVKTSRKIKIGKIGEFILEKGYYLYIGSAHGPGGVKARVSRHLKRKKSIRWHIDYLRDAASIVAILFTYSKKKKECEWASKLNNLPFLSAPINGFGSSDCSCNSHLFFSRQVFYIDSLIDIDNESMELFKFS